MKLLFALSILMMSTMASAQTPSASPTATPVDPTLFQTTSFIRLQNGDFETIPAQTYEFKNLDPVTFKPIVDPLTGKEQVDKNETYIFDARNPFAKVAASGANYAILADKSMVAFSSTWDKPIAKGKLQFDVETYGGNFMIKKGTREIVTISSTGYVNFFTKAIAPAVRLVGGNFFIDANNDVWTIDNKGNVNYHDSSKVYKDASGNKWSYSKYPLAQIAGGNYFYQQDGSIVTITSIGTVLPAFTPNVRPATLGGNYYIGTDGIIYSIRYDGVSFQNGKSLGRPKYLGYSYILYDTGSFAMVDGMGVVHTDAVRVTSTKSKFTKVTSIKDLIDPVSVWTPNARRN
jgi:hypothetical protein